MTPEELRKSLLPSTQEIQTPCWQSMNTFKKLNYLPQSHCLGIRQLKKTKTNTETKKPKHPYDVVMWVNKDDCPEPFLLSWSLWWACPADPGKRGNGHSTSTCLWASSEFNREQMGTIRGLGCLYRDQLLTSSPLHLCLLLLVQYKLCLPSQGISCAFLYQYSVSDPGEQLPWWCKLNIA